MRGYQRKHQRGQDVFVRGTDGRPRPRTDNDIGDIWAGQERVRLAQAIAADRQKAERKAKQREITIRLVVPKVNRRAIRRLPATLLGEQWYVIVSILLVIASLFAASFKLYGDPQPSGTATAATTGVQSANNQAQEPDYKTLVPRGKDIEALGGWARVSPEGSEPVFAYVDTLGGSQLQVSQQLLPNNLRQNTANRVAQLAEQFGPTATLISENAIAYVSTTKEGSQAVVVVKQDVLVLIKSAEKLPDQQWVEYIQALE